MTTRPKTKETRTAIYRFDDGIVTVRLKSGASLTLEDAKENLAASAELTGDEPALLMVESSTVKSIDVEAREFGRHPEAIASTAAMAIITSSPVSRVIGSFFLGINRPPYPTKMFTSETEALHWLEGFKSPRPEDEP